MIFKKPTISEKINEWLQELKVNPLDSTGYASYYYKGILVGVNVLENENTLFIRAPLFDMAANDARNIALYRRLLTLSYYFKDTFDAFFSLQKNKDSDSYKIFLNARRPLSGLGKKEFLKCVGSVEKSAENLLPQLKQEFQI